MDLIDKYAEITPYLDKVYLNEYKMQSRKMNNIPIDEDMLAEVQNDKDALTDKLIEYDLLYKFKLP